MSECPTFGPDEDLFLTTPEHGEDYSDANSYGTLEVLNSNYKLVSNLTDSIISDAQPGLKWIAKYSRDLNMSQEQASSLRARLKRTIEMTRASLVSYGKANLAMAMLEGQIDDSVSVRAAQKEQEICRFAWNTRWRELEGMVKRTFPSEIAEVNASRTPWSEHAQSIPTVSTCQSQAGASNHAVVNKVYQEYTMEARDTILGSISSEQLRALPASDELRQLISEFADTEDMGSIDREIKDVYFWAKDCESSMIDGCERVELVNRDGEVVVVLMCLTEDTLTEMDVMTEFVDGRFPGGPSDVPSVFLDKLTVLMEPVISRAMVATADRRCTEVVRDGLANLECQLAKFGSNEEIQRSGNASAEVSDEDSQGSSVDDTTKEPEQIEMEALSEINLPAEVVGWLDDDTIRQVICETNGVNGKVLVVDCMTDRMQKIAKNSACSPDYVSNKLKLAAEQIASSRGGKLKGLSRLSGAIKDYRYPIMYWKKRSHNADRIYISQIPVGDFEDTNPDLFNELKTRNVHSIVAHVATCDKQNQTDALAIMTGDSLSVVRARGAGSA